MKKNVLALSITAAIAGLGFIGGAQAMKGTLGGAAENSQLYFVPEGVGQMLLVPYFSSQGGNATLINITNTDTVRGKAVKVRFRGAANSDDVFDFQVFLSPGDVWTGGVTKNVTDGLSQLTTADLSCTKPGKTELNGKSFVTARLDKSLTADQKANGTREGYIEIFAMADIPKNSAVLPDSVLATSAGPVTSSTNSTNALYTAIKHPANAAPPCTGSAWTNLDETNLEWNTTAVGENPRAFGLLPPTTGLMANWTIINTTSAASWSGNATAIAANLTIDGVHFTDVFLPGNVVYWPQTSAPAGNVDAYTADPILRSANVYKTTTVNGTVNSSVTADAIVAVEAGYYDLPDMSTPYTSISSTPLGQAKNLTDAIEATSATNDFATDPAAIMTTDWVFSMPTRRYSIALDYAAIGNTDDGRRFTDIFQSTLSTGYFLPSNTATTTDALGNGRQICVRNITIEPYDREENGVDIKTEVVISPSEPKEAYLFCGEASVLSVGHDEPPTAKGTGSLQATVAVKNAEPGFVNGWMVVHTPGATTRGLPVIGSSFVRAASSPTQSYGAGYGHRFGK